MTQAEKPKLLLWHKIYASCESSVWIKRCPTFPPPSWCCKCVTQYIYPPIVAIWVNDWDAWLRVQPSRSVHMNDESFFQTFVCFYCLKKGMEKNIGSDFFPRLPIIPIHVQQRLFPFLISSHGSIGIWSPCHIINSRLRFNPSKLDKYLPKKRYFFRLKIIIPFFASFVNNNYFFLKKG